MGTGRKSLVMAVVLIMIVVMLAALTGCGRNEIDPLENGDLIIDGDYAYDFVEENGIKVGIRIVTLSKQGREKERLEVPAELGGLPVLHIGRMSDSLSQLEWHASSFRTTKLKKIVLPYSAEAVWLDCFYSVPFGNKEGKWVEKVILTGETSRRHFVGEEPQNMFYWTADLRFSDLSNIEYYFNYEESVNNGVYSGDHLGDGEKLIKPQYDPNREGYEFAGWYTEPECINAWDFNTQFTGEETIRLYAKWKTK